MSFSRKLASAFTGIVVALVAFGMMAASASALTQTQMDALSSAGLSSEEVSAIGSILGESGDSGSSNSTSCTMHGVDKLVQAGSPQSDVMAVQKAVNHVVDPDIAVDGKYGPATVQGVKDLQSMVGASTVDGLFGPNTFEAYQSWVDTNCETEDEDTGGQTDEDTSDEEGPLLPEGCDSVSQAFSSTTGEPCEPMELPEGCDAVGEPAFSSATGEPCEPMSGSGEGSGEPNLPEGCDSAEGFSTTTGEPCDSETDGEGEGDGSESSEEDEMTLEGGAGSVEQYEWDSSYSNEEVGEGEDNQEVAALEVEVDDGSDLKFTALRLNFSDTGSANNENDFEDYAENVSVWFEGEKVAEHDAEQFTDDNSYTQTLTLDDEVIIEQDEEEDLKIALSGINNLDSQSSEDDWGVDVTQVRFMDATSAIISEDPGVSAQTFTFESQASAANTEVKFSESDNDDVNDAHVIEADDTDSTDNVTLLSSKVEVDGNKDVELDDLPIKFTSSGSFSNPFEVISTAYLYIDGQEVDSENVTSDVENFTANGPSGTNVSKVLMQNFDYDLEAGQTYEFEVKVEVIQINNGTLQDGDTLQAEIDTSEETAAWDAEIKGGDSLSNSDNELTGSAQSDAHELRHEGIMVDFLGASADKTPSDTSGVDETVTFDLRFNVEAFGDAVWVDKDATVDSSGSYTAGDGVEFSLDNDADTAGNGTNTSGSVGDNTSLVDFDAEDQTVDSEGFKVSQNDSEEFTLSVLGNGAEAGTQGSSVSLKSRINSIGFNVGNDANGSSTYQLDMNRFKSNSVSVFDR